MSRNSNNNFNNCNIMNSSNSSSSSKCIKIDNNVSITVILPTNHIIPFNNVNLSSTTASDLIDIIKSENVYPITSDMVFYFYNPPIRQVCLLKQSESWVKSASTSLPDCTFSTLSLSSQGVVPTNEKQLIMWLRHSDDIAPSPIDLEALIPRENNYIFSSSGGDSTKKELKLGPKPTNFLDSISRFFHSRRRDTVGRNGGDNTTLYKNGTIDCHHKNGGDIPMLQGNGYPGAMVKRYNRVNGYEDKLTSKQRIQNNREQAWEYTPESFIPVTMLYIRATVNGTSLYCFVDSGAQMTIMDVKTAERCGLMHLCDRSMRGVAIGVGAASIIGRIHLVNVTLGVSIPNDNSAVIRSSGGNNGGSDFGRRQLTVPMSITVLANIGSHNEGMLFMLGLDQMLKHQMCIDLKRMAIVIDNITIPFIPEGELPWQLKTHAIGCF